MAATRRGFVRKTMAGAVTAASYRQILGANDRVRLGLIGYGLIGAFHVKTYKKHAHAEWQLTVKTNNGSIDITAIK